MNPDELAAQTADKFEQRDVTIRQVNGGFVVTGLRRFINNDTKLLTFTLNAEGVAADYAGALVLAEAFLGTGSL